MSILERLQRIVKTLDDRKLDARKFDEGNDSAGVRVRVAAMEAINSLKECRKEVQAIRRDRKE